MTFDVIVVGGGPAGAATAVALAQRGLTAAIVERRPEPVARVGETLPPAVRVPLEALGLWDPFVRDGHEPAVGNRSYWGSDRSGDLHFVASPYGRGWHLDRQRFERSLLDAAATRGVAIFAGRQPQSVSGDGDGWTLSVPERLTARFLVDATGRACALARICGVERVSIDRLVGATMFLAPRADGTARPPDPCGSIALIEAMPDGWWYSAPLPGGRLVAAYMTDADIATSQTVRETEGWLRQARRTRGTRERLAAYLVEGHPQLSSANTSRLTSIVGRSWLAIGDAAVSFDPLSSQGIVTALESAGHAAAAIEAHLSGQDAAGKGDVGIGRPLIAYADSITSVYRRYLVERAQYYGIERRWPSSPFWARRQAHNRVLDHAVSS